MPCTTELNMQIKSLMARVSQAEDNISNHFVGISTLVQSMLANPFTAPSAISVESIYNLIPDGFNALQKLISEINPLDMKKYMILLAGQIEDAMDGELGALEGMVSDLASQAVDAAEQAAVDAATSALNATNAALSALLAIPEAFAAEAEALTRAIAGGFNIDIKSAIADLANAMGSIPEGITSALTSMLSANDTLTSAQGAVTMAKKTLSSATSLLTNQKDAANCKSTSSHITSL